MKRILIIHNEYQDPGGEDLVFQQETALLSETVIVETLRFRNKSGFKGFIQFALYPWNLFSWARIQTKIKEFNPDLVHIHNIHYAIGPLALRELHNKGIPTVMTLHNYRL